MTSQPLALSQEGLCREQALATFGGLPLACFWISQLVSHAEAQKPQAP